MGGQVLDYEAKRILNRGKKLGEEAGIELGKKLGEETGRRRFVYCEMPF